MEIQQKMNLGKLNDFVILTIVDDAAVHLKSLQYGCMCSQ